MRIIFGLFLTVGLIAEDSPPPSAARELQEKLARAEAKLARYQNAWFACQDAMTDAQIDAQAKEKK